MLRPVPALRGTRLPLSAVLPLAVVGLLMTGCNLLPKQEAQAQSQTAGQRGGPAAVETAIAKTGSLEDPLEYTGTTQPFRVVSLRSQTEGRLLDLNVDVSDTVTRGQSLGQVDAQVLTTQVNQARAELAALQSEVAQAEAEVSNAQAQVEQARAELQQAQADAARLQTIVNQGAITRQAAEQAQTLARTSEQALRSAQEQVRTRQRAVVAAQGRVEAQRAALAEAEAREAYTALTSPVSGAVLERVVEPGDFIQPGDEVLRLGDFSSIKVVVQVSELELGGIRVGQAAQVRLDAFPDRPLQGRVARISPAADPTARLVPVEVVIPNQGDPIGSGLLARVQFQAERTAARVIVPETAIQTPDRESRSVTAPGSGSPQTGDTEAARSGPTSATVYVVSGSGENTVVKARPVNLGQRANGQVEILSGLKPGEQFVARSSGALKDGDRVRLSITSETSSSQG